ncbi:hypothetical protein V1521DRAFT_442710 [Lipomyces starkeyi]
MCGPVWIRCLMVLGCPYRGVVRAARIDGDYRLFLLNMAMRTGRNHAVCQFHKKPILSVLSITFRQSLARYLATALDIAYYLDDDF